MTKITNGQTEARYYNPFFRIGYRTLRYHIKVKGGENI